MTGATRGLPKALVPVLWVAGFLLAASFTFTVRDYGLFQLSRVACLAIAVLSLNLLTGHAGQISVGQGALFGLGAYTTVLLVHYQIMAYPLAVIAGTLLCFVVGTVIGLPALRLRGLSLGLVTLGAAVVFPELLKHYSSLTGGVFGVGLKPPTAPGGADLTASQWMWLVSLLALALAVSVTTLITTSRFGRGLNAVRVNEDMALATGVNLARSKVVTFGISSAMAGFGGGVYQLLIGSATPDTYTLTLSLSLLFAAVLGGLRSRLGTLVGAAFVVYVPDYTAALGDRGPQLAYAIALLLAIYLLPRGIVPGLSRLFGAWWNRYRPSGTDDAPQPSGTARAATANPDAPDPVESRAGPATDSSIHRDSSLHRED